MHSVYSLQFPILHAKLMTIGLWSLIFFSAEFVDSAYLAKKSALIFDSSLLRCLMPLNWLILLYSIYMVKAVSVAKKFI